MTHPMNTKALRLAASLPLLFAGVGCSSPSTSYEDPNRPVLLENRFSINDLDKVAAESVRSLIGKGLEGTNRPMVFLAGIQNDTSEHIDTQAIADAIQSTLLESGQFRFTAGGQGQKSIQEQIDFQATAALPETAVKAGRQIGARYVLYGRLASFVQKGEDAKSVDYQFILRGANIETGEVLLAPITRIRKVTTNAAVGW
ncbi:MAG: penicillin-binding protein activator LpoB [Planctomycetes bacterium]|nr:penicillin-binding protein activator LpoB [Planctomycetota bacterium]